MSRHVKLLVLCSLVAGDTATKRRQRQISVNGKTNFLRAMICPTTKNDIERNNCSLRVKSRTRKTTVDIANFSKL